MTVNVVSVLCGGPGFKAPGFDPPGANPAYRVVDNRSNSRTPCQCYQDALESSKADIIVYAHDDVIVTDPDWLDRLMSIFSGERQQHNVAAGLGGATALGNRDLYRKPFNIWNMARRGYASNQVDAETHGERFTGVRQVAVLDAFLMAVRTDWLRRRITCLPVTYEGPKAYDAGWPTSYLTHHCLDLWLACEAARDNKEIWMVGASVAHLGGRTSTLPVYKDACWLAGGTLESDHVRPHRWLYEEYRDCLPIEVGQ